jgi:hypothetical protein
MPDAPGTRATPGAIPTPKVLTHRVRSILPSGHALGQDTLFGREVGGPPSGAGPGPTAVPPRADLGARPQVHGAERLRSQHGERGAHLGQDPHDVAQEVVVDGA